MHAAGSTPAEFCMRGAPKFNKTCSTFARFLAKICAISKRRHRAISPPNAALTSPRTVATPCMLCNARGARQPSSACAVHRTSTKFAASPRVFSRNFARFRTPKSRNLGAKCSADSAARCADVVRVAQRTRCTPAEFCMRGAPKSNKSFHTVRAFESREIFRA